MKRVKTTISAIATSAVLAVGAALILPASAGAITYGQPDGNADPNVGALVVLPGSANIAICTGTLITPTVFLTASHCTSGLEESVPPGIPVGVSFDSVVGPGSPGIAGVMHTNPGYEQVNTSSARHEADDVAVLTLAQAPAGITPASLPPLGALEDLGRAALREQEFTAVGYGATERVKSGPGAPQFGPGGTRRVSMSSFHALTPTYLHLSQNPALGDGGTCSGDSGGPNFLGSSDVLAAITITGDRTCRATNDVLRLDTPRVQEFLGNFVALPGG